MKIQYCSDLHLEFEENKNFLKQNPIVPTGEILILAGDIVPFAIMDKHNDFFNYVADNFETTYWIPGNHEYYHFDIANKCGVINESIKSNVHLVNNVAIQQKNVKLIFTTLWSKISAANEWEIARSINDFHVIKHNGNKLLTSQFNSLYYDSVDFIVKEIRSKSEAKTMIITHHVPTLYNYPELYKTSSLNEAFAVELYDLIEASNADAWIYGHHHSNTPDFMIGNTKMLTNQLGYVRSGEHESFINNKVHILNEYFENENNKPNYAQ